MWFRCCLFNVSCKTCKCKSPTDAHNAPVWLDDNERNTHTHKKSALSIIWYSKRKCWWLWYGYTVNGSLRIVINLSTLWIMSHDSKITTTPTTTWKKSVLKEECSHLFQYPCHCFARGRRTECTQNTVFNNDDCIGEQCTWRNNWQKKIYTLKIIMTIQTGRQ